MEEHGVVIVGSGPAAYTAAIYCARAEMKPVCFEGFFSGPIGGQLMTTTEIENFPGFPEGLSGPDLMQQFKKQAKRFGTLFFAEDVSEIDFSKKPYKIRSKKREVLAHSVIIATGATAKKLEIPGTGENELWQKGVTACAICDGAMPIFRDKDLFVVGGGDSAVEEALFLTKYAKRVYIVHRRDQLRASKIMAKRAVDHPKVEVLWDSVVVKVDGIEKVESVIIENVKTKDKKTLEASGLFFSIGHEPNTSFLQKQLELHDNGYIKVKPGTTRTSLPGVFAAGDVQDFTYRQAITAAGSGCMAALDAERYLSEMGLV
ncbi:Thioredoxin reductase [Chlamydiales bacterium SCGC AB-751-O23]|jgi:thioredoxin reductase (NADPH)|nr:Thioredoxin reductase [Chlamydiales bacterium SCGC AB-751-O23]